MHSLVKKLSESGHLTAEQVDSIEKSAQDFLEQLRQDPGLRKEAEIKLSAISPAMAGASTAAASVLESARSGNKNLGQLLSEALLPTAATMLLAGGAYIGEKGLTAGYEAIRGALTKSRHYKNMLENNPDLNEMDSEKVHKAFDTLYNLNPDMAAEPLVAGGYVRRVSEAAETPLATYFDVIKARREMATTRELPIGLHRLVQMPQDRPGTHPAQIEAWKAQAEQARTNLEKTRERQKQREKEGQIEAE